MSNYEIERINLTLLKENKTIFEQRKDNFINSTYQNFKTSYICACSDPYVKRMERELNKLYEKIEKGYVSIEKWWQEYNSNVEGIENALSSNNRNSISEWNINSFIAQKFSELEDNTVITNSFSSALSSGNIVFANQKVDTKIDFFDRIINNYSKNFDESTNNIWAFAMFKATAATVTSKIAYSLSVIEGGFKFIEGLADAATITGTVYGTAILAIPDLLYLTYGKITGEEKDSLIKMMWEKSKSFRQTEYVGNFFDKMYKNTKVGQFISENTIGFKYVRKTGGFVGEWAPSFIIPSTMTTKVSSGGSKILSIGSKNGIKVSSLLNKVKSSALEGLQEYEKFSNLIDDLFRTGVKKFGSCANKYGSEILKNIKLPKIKVNPIARINNIFEQLRADNNFINLKSKKGAINLEIFDVFNLKKLRKEKNIDQTQKKEVIKNVLPEKFIDHYLQNMNYYLQKGETLNQYLKRKKVAVVELNNKLDAAVYFGDSKLYLFEKSKELLNSNRLSVGEKNILNMICNKYSKMSMGDIDVSDMLNDIGKYLTNDEIDIALNFANNGLAEKMASKYTYGQKASIFNYTARGGFRINAYLNDTNLFNDPRRARDVYRSMSEIQDEISGVKIMENKNDNRYNKIFNSRQGDIVQCLDSVISSAKYKNPIITYRGTRELFSNGVKIDPTFLKPGQVIRPGGGYSSSSVIPENSYSHSPLKIGKGYNIVMKILVPSNSGSGAYIENIAGITNYGQTEMVLKRNANLIVTDAPYFEMINGEWKVIIETVIK